MSQYAKLNDEILKKKIFSLISQKKDLCGKNSEVNVTEISRQDLEKICSDLESEVKSLKNDVKRIEEENEKKRIAEEQLENERRQLEKERAHNELLENSISDPNLLSRMKYRFFNLSVMSEDDPEGLCPTTSPPFFENLNDQIKNEIETSDLKFYKGEYLYENMTGMEEYKIKNRNKCFASMIESDYAQYFFVCFRVLERDGEITFPSYWVSNMKKNPSEIFEEWNFSEMDKSDFYKEFLKSEGNIDEIYAR